MTASTVVKHKANNSSSGALPSSLALGETAFNTVDGRALVGNGSAVVDAVRNIQASLLVNTALTVGNSTINASVNSTVMSVGNSTVNTVANSTDINVNGLHLAVEVADYIHRAYGGV